LIHIYPGKAWGLFPTRNLEGQTAHLRFNFVATTARLFETRHPESAKK